MAEIAFFILGDFPCSIWKTDLGTLCGYIGVPPSHPWYRQDQSVLGPLGGIDVHGGITLACHEKSSRMPSEEYRATMLKAPTGGPYPKLEWMDMPNKDGASWPHDTGQDVWWIGFDCAHLYDLTPSDPHPGDVYRDESYVRNELEGLARQAADAMRGPGISPEERAEEAEREAMA
ncbi:hypothetical protein LCGC14_0382590 [marine sediment metagenome]|uniref:Uncharacterized protein n=1 Tax=marine sediment metagenome TaxID=412755 RepID=A0A0F9T1V6_9ZZZZ